jgi:hypothetical protein
MRNPKLLIRIAAGCILFFAFGHSIGHFTRHDVTDSIVATVLKTMSDNSFDFFGHVTTYDGMYTGLSLDLIFTLIVFAIFLWHISNISSDNKKLAFNLLLPLTVCVFCFAITSYLYFFLVPAITCLISGILSTIALVNLKSSSDS